MSKGHKDRMCVVCSRTHPPTIFSCRYKVHPKNVDVLCSFFDRELTQGELCDRCYRLWYKHRKQKEGGGSKNQQGKRKKKSSALSRRKKSKPNSKRRVAEPSDDEEEEEEDEEEIEEEEEEEEEQSDEEKPTITTTSNRKPIVAKKQHQSEESSFDNSSPALNESNGRSSIHALPHLEMQESVFPGYVSSGSSGSSSSLAHRIHKGTSKENILQSTDIKEDEDDNNFYKTFSDPKKETSSSKATPAELNESVVYDEEPTSYPSVLQAILSRQDNSNSNGLVQKLEALSALSTDVRKSKRKRYLPLKSPVKEDLFQLYRGNDPYYLQQSFSKMMTY